VKNLTLRQLKTFETVARRLSFSRAAEDLYLTQPAVSMQIKQLEGHAGVPLFEQLGKKIFLTSAGREMLRHSRAIIDQFREAEDAMARLKGGYAGVLNLGVISAGSYFFPRLVAEFTRRGSGIQLNLAVQNRDELLRQVSENQIDLAVMVRASRDAAIMSEPFAPHPFVIVAPPDHPLAGEQQIPLAALAAECFIVRERGSDTWNAMTEALAGRLEHFRMMEIKSTETIKQAVIAGMGVSFLSAHTISLEVQAGMLAVLDVVDFPVIRNWSVVHRADKQLEPVTVAFKHFLLVEGALQIEQLTHVGSGAEAMLHEAADFLSLHPM